VAETFPNHPNLEKEFLECANHFLLDRDLGPLAVETLAKNAPDPLFRVLAQHPNLATAMCLHSKINKAVENTAFFLVASKNPIQNGHCPFDFVLKNREFVWANSFLMWTAMKAPQLLLDHAGRQDWPNSEFKDKCIETANKTLNNANREVSEESQHGERIGTK
jgi:hypothetical protein